jgi:epoxyqueuosine reductase
LQREDSYKISKYAYGQDYHFVIKEKLNELLFAIQENIGAISGRAFVDSAPVLDKAWAAKSGLGWIGKKQQSHYSKSWLFLFYCRINY